MGMKVWVRTPPSHGDEDRREIDPMRPVHLAVRPAAEAAVLGSARPVSALLRARLPNGPARR
jgi:hypothetical protein